MRNVVTGCCLLALFGLGCSAESTPIRPPRPAPEGPGAQNSKKMAEVFKTKGFEGKGEPVVQGSKGQTPDVKSQPAVPRDMKNDWPGFLGPHGTSISTETGIISPWPKEGLKVVWMKKIGEGYPAPSISKGRLYNFDRHRDKDREADKREDKARLTCMKADTGEEIWRFEYPTQYEDFFGYNGGPRCCPVIDGDRVYIYGVEGMLHCLNTADGKLLWKVDTIKEFGVKQNFFGVGSTPIIEGNLLITQVGGSPPDSEDTQSGKATTNGTAVVAFDKMSGKVVYKTGDELASYAVPVVTTMNGKRLGLLFARHGLLAFDPASGKEEFHFPWKAKVLESVNASNPVVVGNRVLITETYGPGSACLQVKPGGYDVLWDDEKKQNKSLQCHWNTPIYHQGFVYGSSGRHKYNADLRCIEMDTGKVQWVYPSEKDLEELGGRPLARCSLLMIDGHFICLDERGLVLLLKVNPKKYEEVSRMLLRHPETGENLLREPAWAAPVVANGLLYLRGDDHLVCLELMGEKK